MTSLKLYLKALKESKRNWPNKKYYDMTLKERKEWDKAQEEFYGDQLPESCLKEMKKREKRKLNVRRK